MKLPILLLVDTLQPIIPERMIWTTSALKLFRRCKRKFYWKYILRLDPRRKDIPLIIGSGFHKGLAQWYAGQRASMNTIASKLIPKIHEDAIENNELYDADEFEKLELQIYMLGGMLHAYSHVYKDDRRSWDLDRKLIERRFTVDCGDYDFQGSIDIADDRFLVEHKTTGNITSSYLDRLPLDTQVRGYMFGAKKGLGLKPKRVIYNVVRKSKLRRRSAETFDGFVTRVRDDYLARPEFYFHREPLPFTSVDILAFEFELDQTHQEYLHVLASGDPLQPRTWGIDDSECNAWFRMCSYTSLCHHGYGAGSEAQFIRRETLHQELVDVTES